MARGLTPPDVGLSLVEICGTTVVVGVVTALALTSANGLIDRQNRDSGVANLVTVLRDAHHRAVVEEQPVCVAFDLIAQTYSVLTGACDSAAAEVHRGPLRLAEGLRLDAATFHFGGVTRPAVMFRRDGSATPGTVSVGGSSTADRDTVTVDGPTGLVS